MFNFNKEFLCSRATSSYSTNQHLSDLFCFYLLLLFHWSFFQKKGPNGLPPPKYWWRTSLALCIWAWGSLHFSLWFISSFPISGRSSLESLTKSPNSARHHGPPCFSAAASEPVSCIGGASNGPIITLIRRFSLRREARKPSAGRQRTAYSIGGPLRGRSILSPPCPSPTSSMCASSLLSRFPVRWCR